MIWVLIIFYAVVLKKYRNTAVAAEKREPFRSLSAGLVKVLFFVQLLQEYVF